MTLLSDPLPLAALSESRTLFELGLIIVLAAAAPLIAQVLRLPSILMLLALGFGAGAIDALDPNALLGEEVVSGIVSIAVGVILFDSGLDLKLSELTSSVSKVYRRLVSLGILVTWAIGTVAAILIFDLSWQVALVLGAVLVVSGPTVVGPLLEFIRPSKDVSSVLKWEGTLADPIGATLGVLVFQAIVAGQTTAGKEIVEFLLSVGTGVGFGLLGAALVLAFARWFKPSQDQALTGTLLIVIAMVVCADLLRDDSGLITGLVTGAILVNRTATRIEPFGMKIQSAKLARAWRARIASLTTFFIGALFIILSARVSPDDIAEIGWASLAFLVVLVLIARPIAVALSAAGSDLKTNERAFIAWMAPRGIVAAATSSTFALGLSQAGVDGAEKMIPITFVVIVGTALIYGLSGASVAKALGVSRSGPGGVLLIGADTVGRAIGKALRAQGLTAYLWSGNEEETRAAKADGLEVYVGDPDADANSNLPTGLDDIEYVLAVSEDEALNAMVAADLADYFGQGQVFQLAVTDQQDTEFYIRAPILFDDSLVHEDLAARLEAGAVITASPVQAADGEETIAADLSADRVPMFIHTPDESLRPVAAGEHLQLEAGQVVIGLTASD